MHPVGFTVDHLLEDPLDVGVQRLLHFVDEDRAGGVQRPHAEYTLPQTRLPDERRQIGRQVHQLDTLLRLETEGVGVDHEPADDLPGRLFEGFLTLRDNRTLAHNLLILEHPTP